MLRWAQMTPDERRIARENYEMSRVLPPGARQQAWRAYQALPAAQKEKLAAAERLHRRALVVSAPPSGRLTPHAHHVPSKMGPHDHAAKSAPHADGVAGAAASAPPQADGAAAAAAASSSPSTPATSNKFINRPAGAGSGDAIGHSTPSNAVDLDDSTKP
jgi:hypothetical protein